MGFWTLWLNWGIEYIIPLDKATTKELTRYIEGRGGGERRVFQPERKQQRRVFEEEEELEEEENALAEYYHKTRLLGREIVDDTESREQFKSREILQLLSWN